MDYKQDFDKDISFINEILLTMEQGDFTNAKSLLEDWRLELEELREIERKSREQLAEKLEELLNGK